MDIEKEKKKVVVLARSMATAVNTDTDRRKKKKRKDARAPPQKCMSMFSCRNMLQRSDHTLRVKTDKKKEVNIIRTYISAPTATKEID